MKAPKSHSTTNNLHKQSTAQQSNTPFFQKPNENGVYAKTPEESTPFFRPASQLQYKLSIGKPNDKYEKEADNVADSVVQKMNTNKKEASSTSNHAPNIQSKGIDTIQKETVQQKTGTSSSITTTPTRSIFGSNPTTISKPFAPLTIQHRKEETSDSKLQKKEEEISTTDADIERKPMFGASGDDENIQRKATGEADTASSNLQDQLNSSKGSGQALPDETKTNMGNAMGADFSDVKIHTDSKAVQMNQELGAQAFTHGSDIYFNENKYDTSSDSGNHLLAHELTHTVQQGAAIQKKEAISQTPYPTIQRGLVGWITDSISNGMDSIKSQIAESLNGLAEQFIPGYSLFNVILGRNIITGAAVDRSGINIIKAYLELMPGLGTILFNELKESESLQAAGTWIDNKLEELGVDFDVISLKIDTAWSEMSILNGIDGNLAIFKKHLGGTIRRFENLSGMVSQKVKVLRVEATLRLAGAHELLNVVQKSPEAMQKLVENPKLILKYFLQALRQGFSNFRANFGKHFKGALFGWLFGKTAEMGIEPPKQMNIAGLFGFMAQLLGLTYRQVRTQVVAKLGPKGESIVAKLEQTSQIVIDFMTKGPIALWERVKESLVNLKNMVFAKITELVTTQLIQAVVTKLVSMLNPAGALIQLVLTIYKVVKYFIDWWDRLKEIASGVLSSITKVVTGAIGTAASFLENVFANGMTVFIGFLANILGLSGLVTKVKALIKKIATPVKEAVDKVVTWIVEKGKAIAAKLFEKEDSKKIKEGNKNATNVKVTPADKKKHQQIGQAIKGKMTEKSEKNDSFETLYNKKKKIGKQLENQYQPMLSKGINLDIKFKPLGEDGKDGDIDLIVIIAPNDYELKFEVKGDADNEFEFKQLLYQALKKVADDHSVKENSSKTFNNGRSSLTDTDLSEDKLEKAKEEERKTQQAEEAKGKEAKTIHQKIALTQGKYARAAKANHYPNNTFKEGNGEFFIETTGNFYLVLKKEAKDVYYYTIGGNSKEKGLLHILKTAQEKIGDSEKMIQDELGKAKSKNNKKRKKFTAKTPSNIVKRLDEIEQKYQDRLNSNPDDKKQDTEKINLLRNIISGNFTEESDKYKIVEGFKNIELKTTDYLNKFKNEKITIGIPEKLAAKYAYHNSTLKPEAAKKLYKNYPDKIGKNLNSALFIAALVAEPSRWSLSHIANILLLHENSDIKNGSSLIKRQVLSNENDAGNENIQQYFPGTQRGSQINSDTAKEYKRDEHTPKESSESEYLDDAHVPKNVSDRELRGVASNPALKEKLEIIYNNRKEKTNEIIVKDFAKEIEEYLELNSK